MGGAGGTSRDMKKAGHRDLMPQVTTPTRSERVILKSRHSACPGQEVVRVFLPFPAMFMVLSVKLCYEILWSQSMWLISIQYSCCLLFTLYVPVI